MPLRGKTRNIILELSKHPFIKNTKIEDNRFAHRLLLAQIFKLELDADFDNISFPDIKFENLKYMYEKYSKREFGDRAAIIRRRGDLIPIYLLYSYLDKKYAVSGIENDFVNFTINFLSKVESANIRSTPSKFHHIKHWNQGGKTTVSNGQLLCKACHSKIH